MSQERSIEVKVGIVILVALGILAAFVLVLGGLHFEKTYTLYVDFNNPGGLQSGAPVRIAGARVGSVEEMQFRAGVVDPKTGTRSLVRAKLAIMEHVKDAIHEDAQFYVTTQGVLGEQFLAVEPGNPDKPVLPDGAVVRGTDPPRLDLFLAKAYELLDTAVTGLHDNRELLHDLAVNGAALLKNANIALTDNREHINRSLANLDTLTAEAVTLTKDARAKYVDNPKIARIVDNVDQLVGDVRRDSGPMMKDAREALANLNRASALVGDPSEQAKLQRAINDAVELAARANATAADAQAIIARIRKGEGTVGAFVMDEELYDDVQELLRDLKHNPWKLFWKE